MFLKDRNQVLISSFTDGERKERVRETTYRVWIKLGIVIHNDVRILRRTWLEIGITLWPASACSQAHCEENLWSLGK